MSGTFSSFGSALSALRYNRVAMDTASNNVANANTPGYTRRMAVAQATGAPAVPALWSTWNGTSGGVEVGGIERMVDPLLSGRSRTEHASLASLNTRAASLVRFETALSEPGENGVAAALDKFKAGWHDVANNPSDEAARSQLLGRANTLVDAIHSQAAAVSTEWNDQIQRLKAVTAEANQVAKDLASLNKSLAAAHNAGTDANTLLDQRDQLALRLAELTGAKATVNEDTTLSVRVGGSVYVAGDTAHELRVNEPADVRAAMNSPVTLSMGVASGPRSERVDGPMGGELAGAVSVLNEDLPTYLDRLDDFAATLASHVNRGQRAGYDAYGAEGIAMFGDGTNAASSAIDASNIQVNLDDPRLIAASSTGPSTDPVTGETIPSFDASNAARIADAGMGAEEYRSLITDFGVKVASASRVANNQQVLTNQVDASWESLAGVNIDEEMVNLLAAQRAYEGASRVITTLDSVLDTLINRTGITR
jgi:flagellar hook-associated protein 1 FlgK